ncbi:hypothetical protein AQJ23_22835 [Streptomyces antibioticus]|nr:hypothetical protein AQJ23_22835 [Streptomyces antibioticus]
MCFSAAGQEYSVPPRGDDEELRERLGALHRARAAALEGIPTRRLLMEAVALGRILDAVDPARSRPDPQAPAGSERGNQALMGSSALWTGR